MASRVRGMTILSSTIIPRVQRLLETGVLKERPLWLDAVEAFPPLPPPPLPEAQKTGKSFTITYPQDKRREFEEGTKSPHGRKRGHVPPISLFESKEVKVVPQWRCPVHAMDLTSSGIPEYGSLEPTNTVDESLQSHDGADTNLQSSNELSVSVEESVLSDDQLPGVAFSSDAVASSLSTNEMPLESTTEVAHSSKRADEQPSMTIFVQQKGSSNFEDTVSELSELLKTYEK